MHALNVCNSYAIKSKKTRKLISYSPVLATDLLATIMITTIIHVIYKTSFRSTTRFIPYFGRQHNSEAKVGNKSCS